MGLVCTCTHPTPVAFTSMFGWHCDQCQCRVEQLWTLLTIIPCVVNCTIWCGCLEGMPPGMLLYSPALFTFVSIASIVHKLFPSRLLVALQWMYNIFPTCVYRTGAKGVPPCLPFCFLRTTFRSLLCVSLVHLPLFVVVVLGYQIRTTYACLVFTSASYNTAWYHCSLHYFAALYLSLSSH